MSNVKRVAVNSAITLAGSLGNRVFEILSMFLLMVFLSVDDFGYYISVFSYFSIIAILSDLGIMVILQRDISVDRNNMSKYLYNAFAMGSVLLVILTAISYVILQLIPGYPEAVKNLFWYAVLSVLVSSRFKSYRTFFEVMFVVDIKLIFPTVFKFLDRVIFFVCLLLFVRYSHSLQEAALYTVLADSVGFLLLLIAHTKRYKLPRFRFHFPTWKYMAGQSWPILFSSFINVINIRLSILIVTGYFAAAQLATYGFASRIAETIGFLAPAIIQPIIPILSQKYGKDKQVFLKVFKVTIKFLLIIVMPIIVFLVIELDEIFLLLVDLFLKPEYLDSVQIAKILIISQTFMFCFSVFNRALIASYNQFCSFIIITVSVVLNIVLHIILIPKYNLYGAAWATFVSISFFMITSLFFSRARYLIIAVYKSGWAPALAGIVSGLLLYYLDLIMWLTLPLSPALFFLFLFIFRGLKREELEYIYEVRPVRFIRWLIDKSK